ncbi:MAG TPA: ERF family protein [Oculatellaceae cyanobacterium]
MTETKPRLIYTKIPAVMKLVGAVEKNRKNEQQGYKFRGIDEVYNAMQEPLAEIGVFFTTKVIDQKREDRTSKNGAGLIYSILTVEFEFFCEDGSSIICVTVGEGMDSGDKASNKALSAALKYALLQTFCIPTEEPKDSENDSPQIAPKGKQNQKQPKQDKPDELGNGGFTNLLGEFRKMFPDNKKQACQRIAEIRGLSKDWEAGGEAKLLMEYLAQLKVQFDPVARTCTGFTPAIKSNALAFFVNVSNEIAEPTAAPPQQEAA